MAAPSKRRRRPALLRRWRATYGADIRTRSADVMEIKAARLPASREADLDLTHEHDLVCHDTVDQGTATVEMLAAQLRAKPLWHFW